MVRELGEIQEIRTRGAIPPCVYYMYTAMRVLTHARSSGASQHLLHGVNDRSGICHSRRLEEDGIKVGPAFGQHAQRPDQVRPEAAAHAAVVHGDDVLGILHRVGHEAVVDADFSKFILNHGDFPRALLLEDVIDQGCFPRLLIMGRARKVRIL